MEQLDLTALELKDLGFYQSINKNSVTYRKNTINGYFFFNPLEVNYRWYYKTVIGEASNQIHLSIATKKQLEIILESFNCL